MSSFLSREEIEAMGFKKIGENIKISRLASIYGPENITIGSNVRIDDFSFLTGNIIIGNFVHITTYAELHAGEAGIEMKDFSGISSRVSIFAVSDDYSGVCLTNPTVPREYVNIISEKVTLEKHVIVGTSSVILPGVTIGEGTSVGACSLVTKSCEPWKIYAGIPAKAIKDRKRDLLEYERKINEGKRKNH